MDARAADILARLGMRYPSLRTGVAELSIEQRQLTTEIAVQSGQTVLLGGLIQDTTQDSENGIPGLSRIPILGRLFGSTTRSNQRTELLVLITPRVITSTEEASAVTDEYQRRFEGLRPLRNVRGAETRLQENKQ